MIIAGIGSSIEFRNVRHELYDRLHWVSFDYAMSAAVDLLRTSGVFAGLSAGAAYLSALWEHNCDGSRKHVFRRGHGDAVRRVGTRHAEARRWSRCGRARSTRWTSSRCRGRRCRGTGASRPGRGARGFHLRLRRIKLSGVTGYVLLPPAGRPELSALMYDLERLADLP